MRCNWLIAAVLLTSAAAAQECDRTKGVPRHFHYTQLGNVVVEHQLVKANQLAGKVLDPQGEPIPCALVERVSKSGNRLDAAFTDDNGYFQLKHVPAGRYRLRVTSPNFNLTRVTVQVDSANRNDLKIELTLGT